MIVLLCASLWVVARARLQVLDGNARLRFYDSDLLDRASALGQTSSSGAGKSVYTPEAEADRVTALPGAPKYSFGLFGGYVTVSESAGRALYYIFAEAEEDPASKPVVLWLNGGPGCSSLGGGFLAELGPFFPRPDAQALYKNIYAFNKVANIIFLDSPAFTGFSYSNTSADATVGDSRTAQDSRKFLSGFFDRFPQYRPNDLYLSGESYAGHYVPNLAKELVEWNKITAATERDFNLKGFFLGNPWTDPIIDSTQTVVNLWHRSFLSDNTALGVLATCNFSYIPFPDYEQQILAAAQPILMAAGERVAAESFFARLDRIRARHAAQAATVSLASSDDGRGDDPGFDDDECNRLVAHADVEMGPINIYDLYVDVCNNKAHARAYHWAATLAAKGSPLGYLLANTGRGSKDPRLSDMLAGWWPPATKKKDDGKVPPAYDPCVGVEVADYLNRPEVQRALHANTTALPYPWTECSNVVDYSDEDLMTSMLPVYRWLFKNAPALRLMIYSGDVDGIVPVLGTRTWIRELGMHMEEDLKPWYIVDPSSVSPEGPSFGLQVAGYTIKFREMTFASVRNAGHMVPLTQPARALVLFQKFLSGEVI